MQKLLFLFAFFLLFLPHTVYAETLPQNRLIVKFHKEVGTTLRNQILNSIGVKIQEQLRLKDTFVVTVPKGQAGIFAKKFLSQKDVEYAEPDYTATAFETPNDTRFSEQYGMNKIQAPLAWDTTHGSSSISAAIVDTGIQGNHPDITGKVTNFADCTLSSCTVVTPFDNNGHGTHVAGIVAAQTNNGIGVAGAGYNTTLIGAKVLDSSGSGYYSWIANGITWAADNGAKVINMSLGGSSSSSTLQNAVNYAWGKGVVIVAAAGNSNTNKKFYPAAYTNVISVAATDQNDARASFSNYGSWVTVAAPGVSILSAYNNGDYSVLSGTSMASPHVAGEAALIFGKNSSLTNTQVRSKIQDSADHISGTGTYWIYGRINLCSSVDCNGATPTPTATVTPSSTPTRTPTPTPTPTPKPLGTPTPTPKSGLCKLFPSFCK